MLAQDTRSGVNGWDQRFTYDANGNRLTATGQRKSVEALFAANLPSWLVASGTWTIAGNGGHRFGG